MSGRSGFAGRRSGRSHDLDELVLGRSCHQACRALKFTSEAIFDDVPNFAKGKDIFSFSVIKRANMSPAQRSSRVVLL